MKPSLYLSPFLLAPHIAPSVLYLLKIHLPPLLFSFNALYSCFPLLFYVFIVFMFVLFRSNTCITMYIDVSCLLPLTWLHLCYISWNPPAIPVIPIPCTLLLLSFTLLCFYSIYVCFLLYFPPLSASLLYLFVNACAFMSYPPVFLRTPYYLHSP